MSEENSIRGYEMNIEYLAKLLWKRVTVILICAALTCALAVSYAAFLHDKYSSTVKFYVNNSFPSGKEESISSSEMVAAGELLDVYIVILRSTPTLERIIENAELDISIKQLKNMISASAVDGTEVFSVTVVADSGEVSQKLANAVTEILPERIGEVVEGSSVKLVEGADRLGEKEYKGAVIFSGIGTSLGVILSCAGVVIYDVFDKTLKTEKQLKSFGVTILARIKKQESQTSAEYRNAADMLRARGANSVGICDRAVALSIVDALYDLGEKVELVDLYRTEAESASLNRNAAYTVVLLPPDSLIKAKETDGVIASVTYGKTRIDEIEELVERLNFAGVRLLGFVTFDK